MVGNKIMYYLTDSKFVFLLSIVTAFIYPRFSSALKPLLIPILLTMMTFSIKDVCFHHIEKKQYKTILNLVLLNYFFLTVIYVILAKMFITNPDYLNGMLVLGLMPPAVGVIALSYILKGDTQLSFITEFIGYVFSLLFVPIASLLVFGDAVSPFKILEILVYVIIIPFVLSRILHYLEHFKPISKSVSKSVINVCYGISFYIIVGINKDVFLTDFKSLIPVFLLLIFLKFIVGSVIYLYLKNKIEHSIDVLYVLFGTFKNGGAATAITIILFGTASAIPLAVNGILVPTYIIYLEWFILKKFA